MLRFFLLVFISTTLVVGCSGNSEQTNRAYNALGRAKQLDLTTDDYIIDGYIIGIEKYKRKDIGSPGQGDPKRFMALPNLNNNPLIKEQNQEFIGATNDPKSMLVTHVTSYFPKRDYIYNVYSDNPEQDTKSDYELGYQALDTLESDIRERLIEADSQNAPYSHILIMSMGWNNDQYESIYRFKEVTKNLFTIAGRDGKRGFRPLVIGFTWPSAWFTIEDSTLKKKVVGHLGSYPNKADDADEIGYTIANWLINHKLPRIRDAVGPERFPRVVVIGHSFGARLLSRAVFSRDHLNPKHRPSSSNNAVDLFLGLQGAFSARRFVPEDSGEGAPYANDALPTRIVVTSSRNDKANPSALWSKHIGGGSGLEYMDDKDKKDIFQVLSWPAAREQVGKAIRDHRGARAVIALDVSDIVRDHNDILRLPVAELIWFLLEQIEQP